MIEIDVREKEKGFKEQVLATHDIPPEKTEMFLQHQEEELQALRITEGVMSEVDVFKHASGLHLIKKKFGLKRNFDPALLQELQRDYEPHVQALRKVGVTQLMQNYHLQEKQQTLEVDQLFLPYGTTLDWLREGVEVETLTHDTLNNLILPVLEYTDPLLREQDASAYVDSTFKNSAVHPLGTQTKTYYFDFFPPRVRTEEGNIKRFPHHALEDRIEDSEIEYRFFTKPGIIHNFLRRNAQYMFMDGVATPERQEANNRFLTTATKALAPHMQRFFPDTSLEELLAAPFTHYADKFVRKERGDTHTIYQI